MKKFLLSTVSVAFLATTVGAFAATPVSPDIGMIKSMDEKAMTVTLQDGTVYKLPAGFKAAGLKIGEKVAVTWKLNGKVYEAQTIVSAK